MDPVEESRKRGAAVLKEFSEWFWQESGSLPKEKQQEFSERLFTEMEKCCCPK